MCRMITGHPRALRTRRATEPREPRLDAEARREKSHERQDDEPVTARAAEDHVRRAGDHDEPPGPGREEPPSRVRAQAAQREDEREREIRHPRVEQGDEDEPETRDDPPGPPSA